MQHRFYVNVKAASQGTVVVGVVVADAHAN